MPHDIATLHAAVDERVRQTIGERPWPCARGCDHCCRQLARPMALSEAEWQVVMHGFDALPLAERADVTARIEAARHHVDGEHFVCPFLDLEEGACRIYAHRPAFCRSYGAYRGRQHDAFCQIVESDLDALEAAAEGPIIWGNQDALKTTLAHQFGHEIDIVTWFEDVGK